MFRAVMARFWLDLCPLFFLFNCIFCLDVSQIQVPKNNGVSGVFLVETKTNLYSFNATTATEACKAMHMRIATKAEVETANKNGLQTCRFGWVEEQIAVIPRTEKSEKCGKNSLGVSVWRADISKLFDVYCFKSEGPDAQFETTTSRRPETTTEGGGTQLNNYSSKTTHPSSIQPTTSPARSLHPYTSTPSISFAVNTSSTTLITPSLSSISGSSQATPSPQSLSSLRTLTKFSTSSPSLTSHSSTHSFFQLTSTTTHQPVLSQTPTPNRPSIRAVPKALVILSVILLLLVAALGAAWYLKIKRGQRFPSWTRMRPKQITDTEMWRHNIILQIEQDPDLP
ncbi:lymphatic vessel endothelial hyaluronic acid receptor 1-like [Myxocyprinus asiaticus]|uniref:lymphatic vessel endothelial hyaluronic acid receptor 1-like n=1 Tax=Myxocyprinus asiaticus TaxID=70543 RepID=UPI00222314AC|nr:lymphatic vessel endothelial hyaluronic acid receptor 1-like [Myxocyprinus asiaticus]